MIILAVVQGITEFLPISSSGHLAIASRVFFADDAGASFTAVSQLGTELAVLLYFARTGVRNLWVVAIALVAFSAVIAAAEYFGRQTRHAEQLRWPDAVTVGLAQCLASVPGVSRSGATISAGLFLGLDRELAAT